jgi:hypothetical protein
MYYRKFLRNTFLSTNSIFSIQLLLHKDKIDKEKHINIMRS